MGKFDLDDLLSDLGAPDPNAPKERSPGKVTDDAEQPPLFVRNDPAETPRPPDVSGDGFGEVNFTMVPETDDDPMRVRPDDALSEIYTPDDEELGNELATIDDLGKTLVARGVISQEQLSSAVRVMKATPGKRTNHVLQELGVPEEEVQAAVADIARLTFERIDPSAEDAYDVKSLHKLRPDYCSANLVMPLRREGARLVVGTANPDDVFLLDDVKRRLGVPSIKHVLVTAFDIRGVLELLQEEDAEEFSVDDLLADVDEDDVSVVKETMDEVDSKEAESSPVVRYVNHIIQTALKEGASDIHIEPDEKTLKVRFRIDGVLFEMMNPPRKMHAAITSRIKIMSNLDIAERRLPQDGRICVEVLGRKLDLRVSTVPTPKGEKTVMRILDNRSISVTLNELGFEDTTLERWMFNINQPHGIILVTGPTGSGKTTTLYASLQQLDLRKLNVSTVEDPVEYNLSNITQIQTHEKIGMTFGGALRALLRQDPDVVMVGEIRDVETASTAIQASMTGHLVLSTLHTNDAPSSITRLINIGIEPFLVAAAVNGILAQRLVRRICSGCRDEHDVTEEIKRILSEEGIHQTRLAGGTGCDKCRETGYSGRAGVYEMLELNDVLRDIVAANPNVTELRRKCIEAGMVTLRSDGFRKVEHGITTVEEVFRVTQGGH